MGGCEQRIEVIVCEIQKSQDGWGGGGGGLVGGSGGCGGCKPRIEGIVKWGCGFSQGDQSVCVNEGLKGCRSGVGSWWLRTKNLSHCKI